ncbi:MAG: hypothetical protein D6729_13330, partial [Deltaproteobacteria bacterium]
RTRLRRALLGGGVGIAALCGFLLLLPRLRVRRRIEVDARQDLARLLRTVLTRPEAFGSLPELFRRRLLPTVSGPRLSLSAAVDLAREQRLYVTRLASEMGQAAQRRGVPLLDGRAPEVQAVASGLGAVDLDRFEALLARARTTPLTEAAEDVLREAGLFWAVRLARDLPSRIESLHLPRRGLLAEAPQAERVVLVDAALPWAAAGPAEVGDAPPVRAAAVFVFLEELVVALRLEGSLRARVLAAAGRRVLGEASTSCA